MLTTTRPNLSTNKIFWELYLPRSRVDTWEVDAGDELDLRGVIRIIGTAVNIDTVDSVLMNALYFDKSVSLARIFVVNWGTNVRGTEDGAVPVAHHHILSIGKTVRACL